MSYEACSPTGEVQLPWVSLFWPVDLQHMPELFSLLIYSTCLNCFPSRPERVVARESSGGGGGGGGTLCESEA